MKNRKFWGLLSKYEYQQNISNIILLMPVSEADNGIVMM